MSGRFSFSSQTGVVDSFHAQAGAGVVESDVGSYPFHCTQLTGGARAIPIGTAVAFEVVAGLPGRWEAVRLTALPGSHLCPVCGAAVVGQPGDYDICDACSWEDDPSQLDDPSSSGANGAVTLSEARTTWLRSLIEAETGVSSPEAQG
jgi:cold shock CspA family protein